MARLIGHKVAPVQPYLQGAYIAILTLFPVGGAGAIGVVGTRTVKTGDELLTFYRAVGAREFSQLAGTGTFQAGAGSLGGKWMATSAAHAEQWGNAMFRGEPFRIVSARFPARDLRNMIRKTGRYDGIGPAIYAELSQLSRAIVDVVR